MKQITFSTKTLGCRVNQAETDQLTNKLITLGYQPIQDKQLPDIIIINTCVVTQKGERESAKTIRHLKRKFPSSFFIITGCAANLWLNTQQQNKNQLPSDSLFITNEKKHTIPKIIAKHLSLFWPNSKSGKDKNENLAFSKPKPGFRSFVKIQDGCNHFCSYCIVPYLRTRLVSQKPEKIIEEINQLVKKEVKEVVLSGINLSLYGQNQTSSNLLNQLIKKILKETNIARLSLSSLSPELINQELIKIFAQDQAKNQRLSTYLHLALQSASPTVLERMKRTTNLKKLKKSLQSIKEIIPDINFRADIMVGFPGETKLEFQETIKFIKEAEIAFVHLFPYSPRPGTFAEQMIKQKKWQIVEPSVKKMRREKFVQITDQIKKKKTKNMINKTKNVLVLKKTTTGWWGLSDNYWPINISSGIYKKDVLGKIVLVKITGRKENGLSADLVGTN
ncbi:MAG: tRNA (N(6)-L-threonylcarbamoyladenosine(37)-C(2))-methylthiotransferase MtaB [Candidatus Shapirobacteria bacterium]|nr:tRNA (N(6)-L-threonylcarbamoyladenosine(37)-C(2))-methylthiotransferase MtaB [Candidatus Shapirobacteria bacterium]